jgi:PIN domain nuclease of toxin-antitoxin system
VTIPPLLDTHIWVWWVSGDSRLGPRLREALDAFGPDARPHLSDISLWEVAMLVERKRLGFAIPLEQWLREASRSDVVQNVPISTAIAAETAALPPSFHRDPADRIIVATSRVIGMSLLTKDRAILRSRLAQRWTSGT